MPNQSIQELKNTITPSGQDVVDIIAVSDLHSPMFFEEFTNSLSRCSQPDVFLLAGDIVTWQRPSEYDRIIDAIEDGFGRTPIVACFGNEESRVPADEIARLAHGRVKFLDSRSVVMKIRNARVGLIGAPSPLTALGASACSELTLIGDVFEERSRNLANLIVRATESCKYTVLLMHYSPLRKSEEPTQKQEYSWWMTKALERAKPDLIVHGHLHTGTVLESFVESVRVVNVAFPAAGHVTRFTLNHCNGAPPDTEP